MNPDAITLDEIKSIETPVGGYSVTISPHIHDRLERHILILKKLIDRSATKQRWITSAIKEKLAAESNNQEVPKVNTLNVKIEEELDKQLISRIEFIKKFRFSYSKKQWLVDAVLEKLERDEKEVEKKMLEMRQSQVINQQQQIVQLQAELATIKAKLLPLTINPI